MALRRRASRETEVKVRLNLDGRGTARVRSGIGFFDHLLETFAKHGALDLEVECRGDREVDDHHSVEDVGLTLGEAVREALGKKEGVRRYGFASVPLDEALAQATVDLSGRPHFTFTGGERLGKAKVGAFDVELLEDFLGAVAVSAHLTLHLEVRSGRNLHHILESCVKACARALRAACEPDERISGVPSTKGRL
jgi:imidazoleglycerol-phosphate dehydratase